MRPYLGLRTFVPINLNVAASLLNRRADCEIQSRAAPVNAAQSQRRVSETDRVAASQVRVTAANTSAEYTLTRPENATRGANVARPSRNSPNGN